MSMHRPGNRRPVPLKVATLAQPSARAALIGRFGLGAVLFFALKGLLWLAVPMALAVFARAPAPSAAPALTVQSAR